MKCYGFINPYVNGIDGEGTASKVKEPARPMSVEATSSLGDDEARPHVSPVSTGETLPASMDKGGANSADEALKNENGQKGSKISQALETKIEIGIEPELFGWNKEFLGK